jgi:hypothetical protein
MKKQISSNVQAKENGWHPYVITEVRGTLIDTGKINGVRVGHDKLGDRSGLATSRNR